MNTNIELRNHIICEFARHCDIRQNILESHGYISGIDEIVDVFVREVEPIIRNVIEKKKAVNTTLDNADILIGKKTFFNKFKIKISFVPRDGEDTYVNGGTDGVKSVETDSKGNVISCPIITMRVDCGTNLENAVNGFSVNLSHELTHAYNIYQYAVENGVQSLWNNLTKTQRYNKIRSVQNSGVGNVSAVGNILYTLNRMERNSYIAETRRELYNRKDEIVDAKTGFDVVKNSSSYRNRFKMLEDNMNTLFNVKSPSVQNQILTAVNNGMGKNFTNYSQARKYLIKRWIRWRKKYLTAVSKMVYDICDENTVMLDNGPIGKNKNLKNY